MNIQNQSYHQLRTNSYHEALLLDRTVDQAYYQLFLITKFVLVLNMARRDNIYSNILFQMGSPCHQIPNK